MKNHDGTNPHFGPPIDSSKAVIIGGQPGLKHGFLFSEDVIEERELLPEGATRFFCGNRAYGAFNKERDLTGITLLAASNAERTLWVPLVGARVVLRLQMDETAVLDLCTRGDGSTIDLPARMPPCPTSLAPLPFDRIHCPLVNGTLFRVEVQAPGLGRAWVRCILHGQVLTEA